MWCVQTFSYHSGEKKSKQIIIIISKISSINAGDLYDYQRTFIGYFALLKNGSFINPAFFSQ